jgi:hypothetical protein
MLNYYAFIALFIILDIKLCQAMPKTSFYPFGIPNGDFRLAKVDDGFVGPIPITVTFPFFQKSFTSLYVNTNGLVTFDSPVTAYVPNAFQLKNITGVAPFWADIDNTVGGEIYYREVTENNILNQIAVDIRQAFPVFVYFRPIWAFIATWDEVALYDSSNPRSNNTLQAVLATNGRHSFAVFNYANLMWPTASAQKAQAGFNAGDGNSHFVLPGSFTLNITKISELSNINIPGKWIFRVDSENITEGGCNTEGYLAITQSRVYYIGGDHLVVSGPCFKENNNYTIKFDNAREVECKIIDSTNAVCEVPFLKRIGRISVSLAVNGNYTFEGFIMSKDLSLTPEIEGLDYYYSVNQLGRRIVKWGVSTNKPIKMYNYSIFYIYIDSSSNEVKTLVLNDNAYGSGTEIDLSLIMDDGVYNSLKLEYIGVGEKYFNNNKTTSYFSYVFINKIYISYDKPVDASLKCREWHRDEPDPRLTMLQLSPCWRALTLSGGNFPDGFGDFKQDGSCNPNNLQSCNFFHFGAKTCYRSIAQFNGAGKQCCYSANNRLLVGPMGGGSLDQGHPDIPLNHFIKDIHPFFLCCKLSNNCNLYYDRRPSDDGSLWIAPRIGGGSGKTTFFRFLRKLN